MSNGIQTLTVYETTMRKINTFMTNSKYPTSESKVVGVYGLTTSSLRLSFPLYEKTMSQEELPW